MNVTCPDCTTVYRVDPARVPADGVATRCRECDTVFRVESDGPRPAGREEATTAAEPETPGPTEPVAVADPVADPVAEPKAPAFGPQDPQTRARRLARALVSDIKVYNPDKWEDSRRRGSLRKEFRDEILKSWDEYVEQVGEPMAKKTPYFRDALNEILAGGERVF